MLPDSLLDAEGSMRVPTEMPVNYRGCVDELGPWGLRPVQVGTQGKVVGKVRVTSGWYPNPPLWYDRPQQPSRVCLLDVGGLQQTGGNEATFNMSTLASWAVLFAVPMQHGRPVRVPCHVASTSSWGETSHAMPCHRTRLLACEYLPKADICASVG